MNVKFKENSGAKVEAFGLCLPDNVVHLTPPFVDPDLVKNLRETGQKLTFTTNLDSTYLAVRAAKNAMENAGLNPEDVDLVISAPTLMIVMATIREVARAHSLLRY